MAIEGFIADRLQGTLPITWDALLNDPRFGEEFLQNVINLAKENVFGEVITAEEEEQHPLMVLDFAAKIAAIELITPAIDFWMNQPISESATGVNENHTFIDRARTLEDLRRQLIADTRRLASEIAVLVGFRRFSPRRALINTLDDEFLTPSPQEFPRPYIATDRS